MAAIICLTIALFCMFAIALSDDNAFCPAANLECTEDGENVEWRISLKKGTVVNATSISPEESTTTNMDCADLYLKGQRKSGMYTIKLTQLSKPIQVGIHVNTLSG